MFPAINAVLLGPDPDWSSAAPPAVELGIEQLLTSQYYELRLRRAASQLDYLMSFSRGRAELLRDRLQHSVGGAHDAAAEWRDILRLLAHWADPRQCVAQRCPTLWFEFDDFAKHGPFAVPSVSLCITSKYRSDQPHSEQHPQDLEAVHEALAVLGAEPGGQVTELINLVFAALPRGARWIHLSYMLGRSPKAIKLYGVMSRVDLLTYLSDIGWQGNAPLIEDALTRLYPANLLGDDVFIDLNLDTFRDRVRCSLGLAVAQQHRWRGPDSDPTRGRVLALWAQDGLCDADKAASVLAWPGTSASVPVRQFEREARFLDVKLVWQQNRGIEAKAYVGRQRSRGFF